LIKECIKEVIFEEGTLSNIVAEVAQGLGRPSLVEAPAQKEQSVNNFIQQEALAEERKATIDQQRKQLLSAIGTEGYGGVNVFEGTTPLSTGGSVSNEAQSQGPLSNVDPNDPGVDITGIMGLAGNRWSAHMK